MTYAEPNSKHCRFCRQSLGESWTFESKDLPLDFRQKVWCEKAVQNFSSSAQSMLKQSDQQEPAGRNSHIIVGRLATHDQNIFLHVSESLHATDGPHFMQVGDHLLEGF
jgi:hypothetical protein